MIMIMMMVVRMCTLKRTGFPLQKGQAYEEGRSFFFFLVTQFDYGIKTFFFLATIDDIVTTISTTTIFISSPKQTQYRLILAQSAIYKPCFSLFLGQCLC